LEVADLKLCSLVTRLLVKTHEWQGFNFWPTILNH
jgi:hypothetical protein